jgi:hypothetical protein
LRRNSDASGMNGSGLDWGAAVDTLPRASAIYDAKMGAGAPIFN